MNDRRIPRSSAIALLCRYLQCTHKDLLNGPEETVPVKNIHRNSQNNIPGKSEHCTR